jgi:hypothetical protein
MLFRHVYFIFYGKKIQNGIFFILFYEKHAILTFFFISYGKKSRNSIFSYYFMKNAILAFFPLFLINKHAEMAFFILFYEKNAVLAFFGIFYSPIQFYQSISVSVPNFKNIIKLTGLIIL